MILQHKDLILKIEQDEIDESPREWDNLGVMVYSHDQYRLGDKEINCTWGEYLESEDLKEKDIAVCLPLYLYDHGGISMTCGDRVYPYNDRWDSSMVGCVYVTKEKLCKQHNVQRVSKQIIETATKTIQAEVETFSQYLQGDVYRYTISKKTQCDQSHEHDELVESCGGFYGYDPKENGMDQHIENFEKYIEV